MTTQSEQLTNLISTQTTLAQYFLDKKGEIDSAVTDALRAVGSTERAFTVDQVNGNDASAGGFAAPLKSIKEALLRTPRGGYCQLSLVGDYSLTERLDFDGINVRLRGEFDVNQKPKLIIGDAELYGQQHLAGFEFARGASLLLNDIDISVVANNQNLVAVAAVFGAFSTGLGIDVRVKLVRSNITFAGSGALCQLNLSAITLMALSCTGATSGRWIAQTPAGTASNTLNYLVTNLNTL